ncbi:unnamed protein product [Clonostachys rosea]|uniref:Uncharacterized protein n=1 Tax=Bionectria ochroleuca TaxID=29856 RepID=A0ABY6UTP6_BIOOC|nr:unnamed protein product [Clonostachys rosea]
MPPSKGSSLWDNAEFLSDVIIGLYEAGTISKGLTPKMREGLVQYLSTCGHSVTWEGIRAKGYTFTENALRLAPALASPSFHLLSCNVQLSLFTSTSRYLTLIPSGRPKFNADTAVTYFIFTRHQVLPRSKMSSTPSKKARGWDENSHLDLLLAFIYETKATKAVIMNITERMKGMGYTYSFDAIKYSLTFQHVQKLRKTKDISSIQNAGGVDTPTKGTPTKATPRKGASAKKATAKNSRKRLASDDSEIDDDDMFKKEEPLSDVEQSPSKKPVKRVKKEPSPALDDCQV